MLVVDDSSLMRKLISKIVESDPALKVIDTAMNGIFALKKIEKHDPDIILLDIEMPEMDGIEFLKKCRELDIDIPVIILSSLGKNRPEITLKCLDLGAKDFIIKTSGTISLDIDSIQPEIISKIKFFYREHPKHFLKKDKLKKTLEEMSQKDISLMVEASKEKEEIEFKETPLSLDLEKKIKSIPSLEVLTIGISTGGPHALRKIMPFFPSNFPLPILIVQHMPVGFTAEFANNLNEICELIVKEAEDNEIMMPGTVYISPGDKHLLVRTDQINKYISLSNDPPINGHKPSVEPLFDSATEAFKNKLISIIMTGMGKDGAKAIKRVRLNGGITLAQSERTCVVFGMPKVAISENAIDEVIDLDNIPKRILEITSIIFSETFI